MIQVQTKQTKHIQVNTDGVTVSIGGNIDNKGVISLHCEMRNKNAFGKKKVQIVMNIVNDQRVVHSLDTGMITLYGTVTSIFVPGKKSSVVVNKFANMSFDDVLVTDRRVIEQNPDVIALDKDISNLAGKIRRLKVLVDVQDEGQDDLRNEYNALLTQMTEAKNARMKKMYDLEMVGKFNALSIEITHQIS